MKNISLLNNRVTYSIKKKDSKENIQVTSNSNDTKPVEIPIDMSNDNINDIFNNMENIVNQLRKQEHDISHLGFSTEENTITQNTESTQYSEASENESTNENKETHHAQNSEAYV